MLTDACMSLRYIICFFARLHLALSFGVQAHHLLTLVPSYYTYFFQTMIQNSPAIPLVLETTLYYGRVAADTVCFDAGVSILYRSQQATSTFVCSSPSV